MMPVDLHLDDDEDTVRTRRRLAERVVPSTLVATWSAQSSIGHRRKDNQDAWGERDGRRFVVADGVGGIHGGAFASTIAVAKFLAAAEHTDSTKLVRSIDASLARECALRGHAGAATTLVGLECAGRTATVVHVGDSRAYLLRERSLLCLTEDHNVANLRRSEGHDPRAGDARGKPRSLTSYLGAGDPGLVVGSLTFTLKSGDRLLLCSDGVHEQLTAARVADVLGSSRITEAAEQLVSAADDQGGKDNATALTIEMYAP